MRISTLRVSTCAAFIVSALALLTPQLLGDSTGTWDTRAPMPTGRLGSPHAVIDGKLYVASGCCVDPMSVQPLRFTALEVYDPIANTWSPGAPIPIGVYAATAGAIGNMLYVAGGQQQTGNIDKLQVYNPATNSWFEGPAMPLANAASAGGAIGGKLYVATGMNPGNTVPVNTLHIFDPATGMWTTGADIPTARSGAGAAVLNGKLYVAGGLTNGPVNNLEVYDPVANAWQTLAPMPTARYGVGLGVLDGILYAVGGYDNVHRFDIVEAYDPATNTWSPRDPMPEAHYWPAAVATLNAALYVIGGEDASGSQSMSNHRLTLPVTPTILIWSGTGTFTYNGMPHSVNAAATGTGGSFVSGTIQITYDPGGSAPPVGVGSYDVNVSFTSNDPRYTDAFLSVPDAIVINPSTANINGPMSVTAEATNANGAVVSFTVSGFDVDGPLLPVCSPTSGSIFPLGPTQTTCTASGPNSVPGTLTFPVNVVDTRQPVIGPVSHVFATATSSLGANVTYQLPYIADLVDSNPTVTTSIASGSLFAHGMTPVVITVRDASGNTATRTLNVTVNPGLQSVAVTPTPVSLSPGQGQSFTASGAFTDGTTRILQGPSSGPPFSGPSNHTWQVEFIPTLHVGPCGTVNGGLAAQGFSPDASGAVDQVWGNNNVIRATGTADASTVSLTLACTAPGVTATVPLNAVWTSTRYEGSMTDFAGLPVQVSITGWSTQQAMPVPRSGHGASTLNAGGNDVVYVAGGVIDGAASNALSAYHPATNTWTTEAAMPTAREGAGVAALNGRLFVVGGIAGGSPSGVVESFDPQTGAWTTDWQAMPTARSNFSLVAANGSLYAIGGVSAGGVVATVERFDPAAGWTTLAALPLARQGIAAGALNNGGLIVAAGGAAADGQAVNRVDRYDVGTDTWTQGPNLLVPAAGAAGVTAANGLFVFGGSNNGALTLAEVYVPQNGVQPDGWAALRAVPTARTGAGAALVGDVIYVMGGQTGFPVPQNATAVLEAFSLLTPDHFSLSQGSVGSNALPTVTWRLTPASGIASISPFGFVNAVAAGQTTVIAEAGGLSCETTNSCGALTVEAPDTTPPTITGITPSPFLLFFPFGQMVTVNLTVTATDLVDPAPQCGIVAVFSTEPVGTTSPDWQFTPGALSLQVRAERNAAGPGRAYIIIVGCADRSGNVSFGVTGVIVPRLF